MPVQVDDELEKYAVKKPPTDDELERYAAKPSAPASRSDLDDYLNQAPNYGTSASVTHEELPGATPRLKAATGGKATKPVTEFEKEHTPEETGPLARVKQYGKDVGKLALSLGGSALAPLETHVTPAAVSDLATEYASRRIPNVGQTGLAGGRSAPYSALATAAPLAGVDPTGMETSAEHGDPMGVLTHAAAQATPVVAGEAARIPAVQKVGRAAARTVTEGLPSKGDIALKLRTEEGDLKPGVHAAARLAGAAGGHLATYAGIPLVGELGGYAVGPALADALIPSLPVDRPLKAPIGATQPALEDFYQHRAEDLTKRGKEQAVLDKAAAKNQPAPNPLAGMTSTAQPIGSATLPAVGQVTPKPQAELPGVTAQVGPKPKVEPSKIIKPTEGEPVREGNEGRAATWTNEKVLDEAGKGNRVGITQAILRGLPLPENARYVMGDPDTARAVLNPREVTRFTPEGEPIRNKENPFTQEPTASIPTLARTPRTIPPVEQVGTPGPKPGVLEFPGPLPESAPLAPAKAVGEAAPVAERATTPKSEAPTLLEPIAPFGIKPLENAKPIMEAAKEAEPEEVHIKGITAKETAPKKAKTAPIDKRFTSEEIADAEGLLRQEAEAMQAAGVTSHGRQFVEDTFENRTTAAGRNAKRGERMGGHWMTVGGGRDMYPFLRENPKANPGEILKALRNKDSAAYTKLMEKAVEFNRRTAKPPDEAYDFIRGLGANPDAELEGIQEDIGGKEPTFNPEEIEQEKPKPENHGLGLINMLSELKKSKGEILPGMEEHVAKQNEGAAKVAGENLTAEANKPKDISAAAGRMETLSPLFRGTEASPQKEIFGGQPAANAPPAAIQQVLKETGWEYKGKSPNVGVHTIEEPGTNIKLQLWDRELQPDFVRRKIAEKEKQYGVVTNKEGVKGSTLANVERDLNKAGEELREATTDYRNKKIGDIQFMAARNKHDALLKRWEALRGEGGKELNF